MKQINFLSIFLLIVLYQPANSQKAIFLHHSVGANVYSEGHVADWISNYNSQHDTHYEITERAYPDTPYPWDNYPYDYWNLWINNACDDQNPNIECLGSLCSKYDMIIFKHCYPGASIIADYNTPSVSSPDKTIENYKLQYRALRDLLDTYPDNKFIVWTLAPLHRLFTNEYSATKAAEFVAWVKNEWLQEDGKPHPNVKIFDFFGYTAEADPSPVNGKTNCLKYEYEFDHVDKFNSHPNTMANEYVGPILAELIVNTFENTKQIEVTSISVSPETGESSISTPQGNLQLKVDILPVDATLKTVTWSLQNGTGEAAISENGLVTAIADGSVTATATATDGSGIFGSLTITISNQTIPTSVKEISDPPFTWTSDGENLFVMVNDDSRFKTFRLYNLLGRSIIQQNITQSNAVFNISSLQSGIYIVSFSGESGTENFKLNKP